jgi:hypothetical protein
MRWVILALALFGPDAQPSVEIHVAGAPEDRAWMLAHLRGLVEQQRVVVRYDELAELAAIDVLDPPDAPAPARARVWIDLQAPDRAKVYVVDEAWARVLVRPLRLTGGLDEVAAEEIVTIVESSVRALLEGGTIGVAREQLISTLPPPASAPDPIPEPSPPPPPPRPRFVPQIGIAAGYAAAGWSNGVAQHGPLVQIELAAKAQRFAIGGRLEGRAMIPTQKRADPFALRLGGGGARLLATIGWRATDRIALESALGGGVEVVTVRADARSPTAEAFGRQRNALAVLALALGPAFELGRGRDKVLLRMQVGLDVVPHRLRYVTADSGAQLFTPWIVRPGGTIAIGWRR